MAKKKTPDQELKELCKNIRKEIGYWENINQNGCNDPFWADGTNMNLTRNHIIYAKRQISEIYEKTRIPIPEEMYIPIPPSERALDMVLPGLKGENEWS